jgi:hypothetical protein
VIPTRNSGQDVRKSRAARKISRVKWPRRLGNPRAAVPGGSVAEFDPISRAELAERRRRFQPARRGCRAGRGARARTLSRHGVPLPPGLDLSDGLRAAGGGGGVHAQPLHALRAAARIRCSRSGTAGGPGRRAQSRATARTRRTPSAS